MKKEWISTREAVRLGLPWTALNALVKKGKIASIEDPKNVCCYLYYRQDVEMVVSERKLAELKNSRIYQARLLLKNLVENGWITRKEVIELGLSHGMLIVAKQQERVRCIVNPVDKKSWLYQKSDVYKELRRISESVVHPGDDLVKCFNAYVLGTRYANN